MSESDDAGAPSAPRKALRTVTPSYFGRPDAEMDVIGWSLFLGLLIVLVPFLPFVLLLWLMVTGLEFLQRRAG